MTTSQDISQIAGYIALASLLPLALTTVVFGVGSSWFRSRLGWAVFGSWASQLAVLVIVLARRFRGEYPGYEWVALVGYSVLFLAYSAMAVVVILERRPPKAIGETRDERKAHHE